MSSAKKREGSSRSIAAAESSEVDEMIGAAEEELLIGLRVGSHTIYSSLDPDLARRFQALKSPRPSSHRKLANPSPQPLAPQTDEIREDYTEEDLLARFAALKGTVSSEPRSRTALAADPFSIREDSVGEEESEDGEGGDGASKKEVEKVMRWAMDAARLDASRSDDDDEEHSKESDEGEEDDEELESEDEEEKKKAKGKGKPGKWFSLFR